MEEVQSAGKIGSFPFKYGLAAESAGLGPVIFKHPLQNGAVVDRIGFEPMYACAGRFTVCCL